MKLELSKGKGKEKKPSLVLAGPAYADLTPPRSREKREKRELQKKWTSAVIASAIVVAASIGGGFAFSFLSKGSLDNEIEAQSSLAAEIESYSEVNDVVSGAKDLENKRSLALGSEIAWAETLAVIEQALPSGVRLTSYSALGGGVPTVDVGYGAAFVVQISSDEPIAYSAVEDAFLAVPSIKEVIIGDLQAETITDDEGGDTSRYTYPVALGFDNTIFTGRWLPEEAKKQLEEIKANSGTEGDES